MMEDKRIISQAIQGSAAKVLIAFMLARTALSVAELEVWTTLERKAIGRACKQLKGIGLLDFQALANNRQVWLPAGDMLFVLDPQLSYNGTSIPHSVVVAESNPSLSSITTTTTTTRQMSHNGTSAREKELIPILKVYRISGPKKEKLLAAEWVCAEYVRAHVEFAKNENKWDNPVGMAITRMLDQEAMPEKKDERSKYTSGKYGIFVNSDDE